MLLIILAKGLIFRKNQPIHIMAFTTAHKILSLDAIVAKIHAWRVTGQTIVFTNGCFDLMHLGHVDYLEKASALGDKLIVGVNSDASITKLKGPGRPILDEQARARVMASMGFVNGVILFEDDTPLRLIEAIQPDVLVKGADYEIEEIVGHKVVQAAGGRVERIALVEGYSTTSLIKRIQRSER